VNVAGIFYILIGGLALAITIAVLEFFVKANIEAKQTKVIIKIDHFCFVSKSFFFKINFFDVMRRNMRLR
jgi:hypothetical protein